MPRVLVVEDEPENRLLLQVILSTEGYQVTEAEDGRAALDAVQRERPDIILLDVMMPGMNGYAVLEQLRADPATASLPVIMLTALASGGNMQRAVEMGAQGYITKPFEPADLVQAIEATLRGRQ
jgi:two-component system, OmpR family, alkaline phosphatase synthesis response regulator PhoP